MSKKFSPGIMSRCQNQPESLIEFAQLAENNGFDELWLVEDCFFAGGIASTAVALSNTQNIRVGLGIMPAVARNPAFAAMEIAALSRLFPGRLLPGFGHGVADWMKQIGAFPSSQLKALEEVTSTVRALLAGEQVTYQGQHVNLSQVQLEFPPRENIPVFLGIRGPKSLQLSGRVADGTILAEHTSAKYIEWAIEQIRIGQREANREHEPHRVTVYTFCLIDDDRDVALRKLRPQIAGAIASGSLSPYLAASGILESANKILSEKGEAGLLQEMPDEWIQQLAVVGTPEDCRNAVMKLVDAGADSIVFTPIEDDKQTLLNLANSVLPLL